MIYIVNDTGKIIPFPNAVSAKPSGHGGAVVHIVGRDEEVIGNFPMRTVRYYGTELPDVYQKQYEVQLRWESMTPEEQDAERKFHRERKKKEEEGA